MNKDNDYSVFLAVIVIWVMIGALEQCESARQLSNIRHELNVMKYKQQWHETK